MALQLTGWQVVEQEAGITVTRLSSSAAEVLERCCVHVCVTQCECVSRGQVMTNDGKLEWRLPAAHSPCQQRRIRGMERLRKRLSQTHTWTHKSGGHTVQDCTKASESHSHREVGDHGRAVQRRLFRADRTTFSKFLYTLCTALKTDTVEMFSLLRCWHVEVPSGGI